MPAQSHTQGNQTPPRINLNDFEHIRGFVNVAENAGNVILYRGPAQPPDHLAGAKTLDGCVLHAKNEKDLIAFEVGHTVTRTHSERSGSRNNSQNIDSSLENVVLSVGQPVPEDTPTMTANLLEEFRRLHPDVQNMLRILMAAMPLPDPSVSGSGISNIPEDSQ